MVNATIDNTPVSVTLGDQETYSPASGSVEDVTICAGAREEVEINDQTIIVPNSGNGEPSVSQISVVLTDTDTVEDRAENGDDGVYISGYQVNN